MESETLLTPRGKSPEPEAQMRFEPATLHHTGQRTQHTTDWAIPAPVMRRCLWFSGSQKHAKIYRMDWWSKTLCMLSHWNRSCMSNLLSHPVTIYWHRANQFWNRSCNARRPPRLLLVVGCLTSQQHASVSQGRICSNNFTCYRIETEVADWTFYLIQSQYTDTRPTSPSADFITPLECQFVSLWYGPTRKHPVASGIRTPDHPLSRRSASRVAIIRESIVSHWYDSTVQGGEWSSISRTQGWRWATKPSVWSAWEKICSYVPSQQ